MIEHFLEKSAPFEQTRSASDIVGSRVLATNGGVLGRVRAVRLDGHQQHVEGLLVRRFPWQNNVYVSTEYIHRITPKAVLLSITPLVLLRGRSVVSRDGKQFGRVSDVVREADTNKLVALVVRRFIVLKREIPADQIHSMGSGIILRGNYSEVKDAFKPSK